MAHEEFIAQASRFGAPKGLAELVEREIAASTFDDVFNNPDHQPLKDAWQAAHFGLGYQERVGKPVEVRLSSRERFPDFKAPGGRDRA